MILLKHQTIKIILLKAMFPIGLKKFLWLKKVKNAVPRTYFISDRKSEEILGVFSEKELQKTYQNEFRVGNIIKRKGYKLYVKWKGYDFFNRWIDK